MDELDALNELVLLGRGVVEIGLTENGNIGIWWAGRKGCMTSGDSIKDALSGRYFRNELMLLPTRSAHE